MKVSRIQAERIAHKETQVLNSLSNVAILANWTAILTQADFILNEVAKN